MKKCFVIIITLMIVLSVESQESENSLQEKLE